MQPCKEGEKQRQSNNCGRPPAGTGAHAMRTGVSRQQPGHPAELRGCGYTAAQTAPSAGGRVAKYAAVEGRAGGASRPMVPALNRTRQGKGEDSGVGTLYEGAGPGFGCFVSPSRNRREGVGVPLVGASRRQNSRQLVLGYA